MIFTAEGSISPIVCSAIVLVSSLFRLIITAVKILKIRIQYPKDKWSKIVPSGE